MQIYIKDIGYSHHHSIKEKGVEITEVNDKFKVWIFEKDLRLDYMFGEMMRLEEQQSMRK